MEKVFIGIITYNRPQLVRDAIESVRKQIYLDYRVLVSDNCSEPDVSASVEKFVNDLNDFRFSYYRQTVNVGEYGQGRFLFNAAGNAEYFLILHDDDLLGPEYLEKGLEILEKNNNLAFYVANPSIIDDDGNISSVETDRYLKHHGRLGKPAGEFDVETRHMDYGFAPISGTLFRIQALKDSGFVNPAGYGNFPFECDIFICLGERGAKAWFNPEKLLSFRFHKGSQRSNINIMDDPKIVDQMIDLFIRPCFHTTNERRRKVVLSRLYRAQALISFKNGGRAVCRESLFKAFNTNYFSAKAWLLAIFVYLAPGPLSYYCRTFGTK